MVLKSGMNLNVIHARSTLALARVSAQAQRLSARKFTA